MYVFQINDQYQNDNGLPQYLIWWHISDTNHKLMKECEVMARIVCKVSKLRSDDYRLTNSPFSTKRCSLCYDLALEDANHMILQCNFLSEERARLFEDIENIENEAGKFILRNSINILWTILGKPVNGVLWHTMITFWSIVATNVHVYFMYRR